MRTASILMLFAYSVGLAQTQPAIPLPPDVRLYEPKNLTPEKAQRVAISVRNLVGNTPVLWDDVIHSFVIRSGNPAVAEMAEALLKRYDVPDPRVELTVYLIRASLPSTPPTNAIPSSHPLPADLKAAIDEMKGAFNYDRYTLWDSIIVQPKGGGGEVQGILPSEPGARNYVYTVSYGTYGGQPAEGKTINLANFMFAVKMPTGKDDIESHIRTDITIREGEKLVLGKIRLLSGTNADLFLVLTAKVY